MGVSKETVLNAFERFKELQDDANADTYVAKVSGKSLVSDAEIRKLAGMNPSAYATKEQIQAAFAAVAEILGGSYSPPEDTGGTTDTGDNPTVTDPEDEGDEDITMEDLENLFK